MTFTFTINDRLLLENAIGSEQGGEDDVQELRGELFGKIKLTEDERTEYLKAVPGGVLIDKLAPDLTLDLDKHEVRKLKAMLVTWKKQFGTVYNAEPVASLLAKLTAVAATAK